MIDRLLFLKYVCFETRFLVFCFYFVRFKILFSLESTIIKKKTEIIIININIKTEKLKKVQFHFDSKIESCGWKKMKENKVADNKQ